jgi:hypothetical protein
MRGHFLISSILALAGSLLVAGPAEAGPAADPTFTIEHATSLNGGAIELTSVASCAGGGEGQFTTALSQVGGSGQAFGTGDVGLPCDGTLHKVYTLVLPAATGAALAANVTATKTKFQPSPYPAAPWSTVQTMTPETGDVTALPDVPGAPTITLDSAVKASGRIAVDVVVTVTCAAGNTGRLSLVLTELGFHNRVVYGTTPDQRLLCTGAPQQRTATMVLSAARSNSQKALISMSIDAGNGEDPAAITNRWVEDDLLD